MKKDKTDGGNKDLFLFGGPGYSDGISVQYSCFFIENCS